MLVLADLPLAFFSNPVSTSRLPEGYEVALLKPLFVLNNKIVNLTMSSFAGAPKPTGVLSGPFDAFEDSFWNFIDT